MPARKPSADFTLLSNGDVLVTVTVALGEDGVNDLTQIARCRLSNTDFCTKAFPIFYQHYRDNWPPPPAPRRQTKPTTPKPHQNPSTFFRILPYSSRT